MNKKNKNKTETYIKHQIGMYLFFSYLFQLKNKDYTIKENAIIKLSEELSSRFAIGIGDPKKPTIYGEFPFLLIQKEENLWFSKINWDVVKISKKDHTLNFISKTVFPEKGITSLNSIRKIIISIKINDKNILNLLSKFNKISFRGIWIDNNNTINIEKGFNKNIIQLKELDKDELLITKEDLEINNNFDDMLFNKLKNMEQKYKNGCDYIGEETYLDNDSLKEFENDFVTF